MFKSFKSKLIVVIIGIAVIPLLLSFIFVLSQIEGTLKEIQLEEVKKVREYVKKSFEEFERNAKTYIGLLKSIPDITDVVAYTVKSNDRKQLIEVLKSYYNAEFCDTLQIIDTKGNVLVRAEKPNVYGDSKSAQNLVKLGLQGQEGIDIETGLAGYAIRIVAPIKSGGDIVGLIMIGKFLNDNFAGKISQITESKIVFFYKDELTGSNLWEGRAVDEKKKDKIIVTLKEIIKKNKISSLFLNSEPFKFSSFSYGVNNEKSKGVDVLVGISIKDSLSAQQRIQLILLLLMLIVTVTAVIISQFFGYSLTKPLMSLAGQVGSWKGDFSQRIIVESRDETAKVAEAFNKLMSVLTEIVNEVYKTANKVTNEAQELSVSTQDINATTEEVSSTIQKIAEGASVQADRMEATSSIMRNIDSSSKEISVNANETVTIAQKSLERARKVGETVALTVEKMESISKIISEAVDIIKILGNKSQEIGQITETITSVAEQTNLLALNAAIEAARAGESGRGFAVVAEEVKKLAEGSGLAAHKINLLIKGIQLETQKAITSIEAGYNEVKEGKRVVNESSAVLWEITDVSEQSTKMIVDMATVIQKQIGELGNVMKTMEEVASIAQNNSAATEETAGSMQEVTSSMEQMSSSAQGLFNLALELKKMVEKFGLKEEKGVGAEEIKIQKMKLQKPKLTGRK